MSYSSGMFAVWSALATLLAHPHSPRSWPRFAADWDGDGWTIAAGDCDDRDPAVHPGAPEVCDPLDIDEDCDGTADDADPDVTDQQTWYADADADGYGDPATHTMACDAPLGWVADDTDCDDTSGDISPGAAEICDGMDDDCDGAVDDDPVDGSTWYADVDGDGFGDPDVATRACTQPEGTVDSDDDCDDADAASYPGAPDILGEDGRDCDGDRLMEELSLRVGDLEGGGLGRTVGPAGDVDGDGVADMLLSSPYADVGSLADAGVVTLVLGRADGAVDLTAEEATLSGDAADAETGDAVTGIGDWDGDGYGELAIGAPLGGLYDGEAPGAVYVLLGPVSGDIDLADADLLYSGIRSNDRAGTALAEAGDWDGDGYPELLVDAEHGGRSFSDQNGTVYVLDGTETLSTTADEVVGATGQGGVGAIATGDVDGDGIDDLLAGNSESDLGGRYDYGVAYLMVGPVTGSVSFADAEARVLGDGRSAWLGDAVAMIGDADGDGYGDMAVSELQYTGSAAATGAVWIFAGPSMSSGTAASVADASVVGDNKGDKLGSSLAAPGDVDGDGLSDLAVGVEGLDEILLYRGPIAGSESEGDAADVKYDDTAAPFLALGAPGDVDGDGLGDLLIGAPSLSTGAASGGGVYLLVAP